MPGRSCSGAGSIVRGETNAVWSAEHGVSVQLKTENGRCASLRRESHSSTAAGTRDDVASQIYC